VRYKKRICGLVEFLLLFYLIFGAVSLANANAPNSLHLQSLTAQAVAEYKAGNLESALAIAQNVTRLAKLRFGERHIRYVQALNNLALLQDLSGSFGEAEDTYRIAINIVAGFRGNHDVELAELKNNLAAVVLQQCRVRQAQKLYRDALALTEAAYGRDHKEVAWVRANIQRLERYTKKADLTNASILSHTQNMDSEKISHIFRYCTS